VSTLLETVRIEDGIAYHLPYHEARMRHAVHTLYGKTLDINLSAYIQPPVPTGIWRCRILYDTRIRDISYHPYQPRTIRRLKMVPTDIDYAFKYADRSAFEKFCETYADYDDIIFIKNGFITDTTIANLAFFDGKRWLTPDTPLLEGTTRARLLDEGKISQAQITSDSIFNFQGVALMNAMVGFKPLNDIIIE
jgi:4-amino-4-deoxychorismate lyase